MTPVTEAETERTAVSGDAGFRPYDPSKRLLLAQQCASGSQRAPADTSGSGSLSGLSFAAPLAAGLERGSLSSCDTGIKRSLAMEGAAAPLAPSGQQGPGPPASTGAPPPLPALSAAPAGLRSQLELASAALANFPTFMPGLPPGLPPASQPPPFMGGQLPWYMHMQGGPAASALQAALQPHFHIREAHAPPVSSQMDALLQRSHSVRSTSGTQGMSAATQRPKMVPVGDAAGASEGRGDTKDAASASSDEEGQAGVEEGAPGGPSGSQHAPQYPEDKVLQVRKRLAQNREAARKSRQRRKQYVQKLEEEVRALRETQAARQATGEQPLPHDAVGGGQPARSASFVPGRCFAASLLAGGCSMPGSPAVAAEQQRVPTPALTPAHLAQASPASAPGLNGSQASLMASVAQWVGQGNTSQALLLQSQQVLQQNQEILLAYERWRQEHLSCCVKMRRLLDSEAGDAALRPLVEEARAGLWTLFHMKKAVICSDSVLLVMNMEHLVPSERLFSWLGGLRASDAAGGLLVKLAGSLTALQRMKLEALKESLGQQEAVLGRGLEDVLAELRAKAAATPLAWSPAAPLADQRVWDAPAVLGKLDAMRMLLLRADGVWEQYLEETERHLGLRQYAVAVIAYMEMSVHLQNLHVPWLMLMRRTGP